jgi:hypothetical protein
VAVTVIYLAFFRIMQNLIGLGRLFETLLGLLVSRVSVRMVFEGHAAIAFFDLRVRGVSAYVQNFVVVAFLSHNTSFSSIQIHRSSHKSNLSVYQVGGEFRQEFRFSDKLGG